REEPNPFTHKGVLAYHLQSFWIAVRREMFLSDVWASYWRDLPAMPGYFDAVLKHETVFTETFADAGYTHDVAFPSADYPTDHPALFNPDLLLADGCPLIKRRPFFHYPPFLDRHAVIGRQTLRSVASYGFPLDVIWQNLARNVPPKVLNADAGMLEVLPDVDVSYDPSRPFRIVVILHVPVVERLGDALKRLSAITVPFDLVVTTTDREGMEELTVSVDSMTSASVGTREVRLLPARRGRDMSAFFVGCRDILRDSRYDLVVKVHTRTPKKRSSNHVRYFRRYQFENLLGSPGYFANVLGLFQSEPGLGVVFPPPMHIGYATAGRGWIRYRERALELCTRLGIKVPLDGVSPLAPLGGMWIARPEALELLTTKDWEYDEYVTPSRSGGDLARVQERLVPLAAGEQGFHARTVMNTAHAGISHAALEYKVDQLSATTPGYPVEQIQFLHRAGWAGHGGIIAITRMYVKLNHPRTAAAIDPVLRPLGIAARRGIFALRAVKQRVRDTSDKREVRS
ncbi:rhamnan synthesis F family protein, partial [Microbacterium sp. P5_E9]